MHRIVKPADPGPAPPSKAKRKTFACPNGCGRKELAFKAPFYNTCPECFKPAGKFVPA